MSDFEDDYMMEDGDEDMDMDDDMFSEDSDAEMGLSEALETPMIEKQGSYEVLSESKILSESEKLIEEVKDFLGIPNKAIAACLLRAFQWNREGLIETYMDNPDGACAKAGVPSMDLEKPIVDPEKVNECLVCTDEFKNKDSFALPCGHRYCSTCWTYYLEIAIKDGAECIIKKCMAPNCNSVVHEEAYKKIVSPELFERYKKYLLRSFVEDNPKVKWCPAPGCGCSIRCERGNRKESVTCKCGFSFCFQCADLETGNHMPADCDQVDKWRQKAADESENVTWMIANTKKCPQCRSPIEKNGGCMHMTCHRNSGGCGFEFCWLCRGPWTEHGSHTGGYYSCNKYDSSNAKTEDAKAQDTKTELEHYMFYYHRYESHKNAMKIADDQRRNADKRQKNLMNKFDVRAADTKFMMEATEQLLHNRNVLQWSYVYGFYLQDDRKTEKNLYEYLQEDLEKHTNYLSELYERPIEKITDYQAFIKWKEDVTNYTRVCCKFLANFIEGVSGGLVSQDF
eukprot:TRINITY_DN4881_c0_g2_i1.p1 TRINITY_DN4881_c0_g2~~TRINITY_DN4881_c0_g2_i1.p1  ORF type:complete len:511 (-),score=87.18 TRINITY_DN4881_c0_g2_i1:29-1561(-)